jgi:uncharacterized protein DUF4159
VRIPALRRTAIMASCAAALVVGGTLSATLGYAQFRRRMFQEPNASYDGRFTFVRLSYTVYGRSGWEFDYPAMERNFMTILNDLTSVHPHVQESNIHAMDDPELGRYPVAYLSEPGWWHPDDSQAAGLRRWIAKGGFLIVDDFHFDDEWWVFETAMRKVLPDARIDRLDVTHPVFNSFFKIKSLHIPYPGSYGERGLYGEFFGIYDNNDSTKRLSVVINYNMDVGDYVEWAQSSRAYSFEPTNEAYKFMINYVVYGLTH